MRRGMKFYIVDAFADEFFGGNPAAIVLMPGKVEFPPDDLCVKIAAELRYSETAFVRNMGDGIFDIVYFTPAAEIELCGHATIGAFAALKEVGQIGDGQYRIRTITEELDIEVSDDMVMMDMAEPSKIAEITDEQELERLYDVMGLNYLDIKKSRIRLRPEIISAGLPDIMLPVRNIEELNRIEPDFNLLSVMSENYGVVGVHAFTRKCDDATCHVRNFAPLYDINEESATGTANAALTYYAYLHGFVKPGKDATFIQGERMNRPSVVRSNIEVNEDSCKIRVGGKGQVLAYGELNVERPLINY